MEICCSTVIWKKPNNKQHHCLFIFILSFSSLLIFFLTLFIILLSALRISVRKQSKLDHCYFRLVARIGSTKKKPCGTFIWCHNAFSAATLTEIATDWCHFDQISRFKKNKLNFMPQGNILYVYIVAWSSTRGRVLLPLSQMLISYRSYIRTFLF